MSDIEDAAIEVVAEAVGGVREQRAMAAAIMRIAGNCLAKLTNNEEAALTHSRLARRHFERIGKGRR